MRKTFLLFGVLVSTTLQINAQTTLFNETFEANSPTLSGWTTVDRDNDTNNWLFDNQDATLVNPMGFSNNVYISISQNLSPDNLLVSPNINIPAGGNLSLSYQIASYFPTAPAEHYAVYVLPAAVMFTGTAILVFEETLTASQAQVATTRTINISTAATVTGLYKVYFRHYNTASQGAIILDNVKITQNVLGTSEVMHGAEVGIYPNPATDYITVKSKTKLMNAEIYDMTGRKINTELKDNRIDVKSLQSGNYILKTETKEGVSSHKFIKK